MLKSSGKIFLFIFLALILAGIVRWSLNYSGVCIPEKRILSDEEKIHIAADHINKHDLLVLSSIHECRSSEMGCNYIRYKSADDLISQNPNCCSVSVWDTQTILDSSFSYRIAGSYAGTIEVDFKANYKDKEGQLKGAQVKRLALMGNCGHVDFVMGEDS